MEEYKSSKNSKGGFFSGMIFGALLGSLAGLLYAPESGEGTRQAIRARGDQLRREVKQSALDLQERATGVVEEVTNQAEVLKKRGKRTIESNVARAEQTVKAAAEAAKETWGETQQEG